MSSTRSALATTGAGLRELLALRWVRVVLFTLALAVVSRAGLELALARAVNRLAAERGLACTWEDLSLSLLRGRGEVRFLAIGPRDASGVRGPDLLEIEYGVFDLELLPLLTGRVLVRRAEVDGLDARLERDAGGTWNFEQHVAIAEVLSLLESDEEPEQPDAEESRPIELKPLLAVEALRAQHARLRIIDHSVQPPIDLTLESHAGLSRFSTSARPARFSATLTGERVLDGAHLAGELTWLDDGLRLTTYVQFGGLRLLELEPWLAPLDIRPAGESLQGTLRAELELRVVGEARDALQARVALTDVRLAANGVEALALDALTIEVESASAEGMTVPEIELSGIRARAELRETGAIRVAGLDLLPVEKVESSRDWMDSFVGALELWTSSSVPRWATLLVRRDPDAYPWSLGAVRVREGEIQFTDHTLTPPASFPLFIDRIDVGRVVHDPARKAPAIPLSIAMRAPGMAESISVTGEIGPFAPERAIDLTLEISGLGLRAMAGHLERAGLERDLEEGSFHLQLVGRATTEENGRTEGWIELNEVGLREGRKLFGVREVKAHGLLLDPDARLMRMDEIEITGPSLSFARDPSNEFVAFGLRTLGLAPTAEMGAPGARPGSAESDAAAGASDDEPLAPIRFEVGRFAWTDSDVSFVDEAADPPVHFAFDELGFELTDLTVGGDPNGPLPEPARFVGRAVAPGLFDELTLEGAVRSRPGGIDLTGELSLRGSGLRGSLIAPYVRVFGLEPALDDGQLSIEIVAALKQDDGWRASLQLSDVALTDGGRDVWTLGELRVDDVRLGAALTVGSIAISDPYLRLAREPDGAIFLGGIRLLEEPAAESAEVAPEHVPPALVFPALPPVRIESMALSGARIAWTDASFTPPIESELFVEQASCTGLGTTGEAATFQALLRLGDTLGRVTASGSLELGPQRLLLHGAVQASGIRAGSLTRMLPPGVSLELADGNAEVSARLEIAPAAEGGLGLSFSATGLVLREGDAAPLVELASFELHAPRVDPAAGVIALGPLRAEGLSVAARRDADGVLHAAGLRVEAAESTAESGSLALPRRIELVDEVLLSVERFSLRDGALGAEALPIAGNARFHLSPCVLIDEAPEELPPIEWEASGALDGLIGHWGLAGTLSPFAAEPKFALALEASGVRTAGLTELVPALAEHLSGTIEDGRVEGRLEGTLYVRRARPTELGLSRPFGAELELHELAFRAAPDGELLAGVEHVRADVERIDPQTGFVHVKTIEIRRPKGVVRRNGMALRALGLELALTGSESSEAETVDAPLEPEVTPEIAPEITTGEDPAGELRIDELLITGIDFHVWDDAADPPLHIAPASLDVELKRLTTRALSEKRPIQFSALLEGAEREGVFDEVALSGRVTLFPEPAGWATFSLAGLELTRFAGLAAEQGVDLRDGALDTAVRLRLKGADGARVHASLVFSDLELSELSGGPIESTLGLSMPLESALFLLRNANDEHRFSLGFTVDENGLSKSQMVAAGTQAFAGVLAGALLGAPLRLLGALIPGGDAAPPTVRESWALHFAPGATELEAGAAEVMAEARRRLSADDDLVAVVVHELTVTDLARAERLANPSTAECLELARGLRQRKAELLRRRAALGTEARTFYAVGADEARAATDELRALERDLASIEDGLDQVFQIVRSDSPRQRSKRTRGACREIANLRLEAAVLHLRSGLASTEQERIEVRTARFDPLERSGGGSVVVELRER